MEIIGNQKSSQKYNCKLCDYTTCKKTNFLKHLSTDKHKNFQNGNLEIAKVAEDLDDDFLCQYCGQKYKTNSGLWKHTKKCNKNKTKLLIDIIKEDKNVQDFLIEQNKILIEQLAQQNKNLMDQNTKLFEIAQSTNKIGTMNNNVNSNNKFNINVFLNETCKDAINLTDFVNKISLSINDLEETGKLGYVEGISNVFIKNLNEIDYRERPIHCSDSKRDILYIKDDNQWTKDDNKDKITNAIKIVSNKNIKQIKHWQEKYPDYKNPDSKQNDKYIKMVHEVMSGSTKEEQQKNYNKIIKNITKQVIINKEII